MSAEQTAGVTTTFTGSQATPDSSAHWCSNKPLWPWTTFQ